MVVFGVVVVVVVVDDDDDDDDGNNNTASISFVTRWRCCHYFNRWFNTTVHRSTILADTNSLLRPSPG